MEKNRITGSFQLMKSMNRSLILNVIREKESISRAEIAKLTKLTPPTVTNIVRELLETDLVVEQELGQSKGGRKPTLLTLNSDRLHVIGVDIGSQNLKVILTNLTGTILKKKVIEIPAPITNEALLSLLIEAIRSTINDRDFAKDKILGIGIGMHGIVDIPNGLSVFAPNLNLRNIPIKEALEEEFSLEVKVENDARAMTLGELWFGNGVGVENLVCINIGRGIGAGIVIDGKLHHGSHHISGEMGHMTIDLNGPPCTCGNNGCLQSFASGPAIAESARKEMMAGNSPILAQLAGNDAEAITGELVYEAALNGDLTCRHILEQAGRFLGIGMTNLIHIVNPQRIILGGGVSNAGEMIVTSLIATVNKRTLTEAAKQTEMIVSKLKGDATALGAVALILVEFFRVRAEDSQQIK